MRTLLLTGLFDAARPAGRTTRSHAPRVDDDNRVRQAIHLRSLQILFVLGLCGLLGTGFVSLQLWRAEQTRLRTTFNDRLNNFSLDLEDGLKSELQVVDGLAGTQASLNHFDRPQFYLYAQSVFATHPEMLALGLGARGRPCRPRPV